MAASRGEIVDPVMKMQGVSVSFDGKEVISDVEMTLLAGEITCLMGPSGCGKTTTLKVASGLLRPVKGSIELLGKTVGPETDETDLIGIRRELGVVFQGGALFDSMSVGQNIAFPLRYCRGIEDPVSISEMVLDMLDHVELGDVREKYPSELSGGMRKRVAIARSLVHSPSLLLLDEPTTGLDPTTARHIDQLVVELCGKFGFSVLVVTHDITSALGIGDSLLLMHEGRITWRGSPDDWARTDHPVVKKFAEGMVSVGRTGGRKL
ncbi:MAG TPA: ATP-binding cassette domain-containing protein [Synergistales bacterium]|nr:ATP-binding cassette domain-containing protein [Synergistales bacterium]HPE91577.1 ATP-binding cassette domain-containing protein [Synergistales bacterium]